MEFISTKDMKHEDAPEGNVLVQYLEPSFGYYYVEFAIAYYDNPKDYENPDDAHGWIHANTNNSIKVIAYTTLPEPMKSKYETIKQGEVEYSDIQFGNAGE